MNSSYFLSVSYSIDLQVWWIHYWTALSVMNRFWILGNFGSDNECPKVWRRSSSRTKKMMEWMNSVFMEFWGIKCDSCGQSIHVIDGITQLFDGYLISAQVNVHKAVHLALPRACRIGWGFRRKRFRDKDLSSFRTCCCNIYQPEIPTHSPSVFPRHKKLYSIRWPVFDNVCSVC